MGNITGCGTGAAIELDAGPDGDSMAAILFSNLSIMVTATDISELVTWEVGPETSWPVKEIDQLSSTEGVW